MVAAPARNDAGRIVGAIGVIGPTRINYGRIERDTIQERLALLDMLPIETDGMSGGSVWRSSVLTLADTETLTFYDAIYLELAIRRGLPLASNDAALRRAAHRRGAATAPAMDR